MNKKTMVKRIANKKISSILSGGQYDRGDDIKALKSFFNSLKTVRSVKEISFRGGNEKQRVLVVTLILSDGKETVLIGTRTREGSSLKDNLMPWITHEYKEDYALTRKYEFVVSKDFHENNDILRYSGNWDKRIRFFTVSNLLYGRKVPNYYWDHASKEANAILLNRSIKRREEHERQERSRKKLLDRNEQKRKLRNIKRRKRRERNKSPRRSLAY